MADDTEHNADSQDCQTESTDIADTEREASPSSEAVADVQALEKERDYVRRQKEMQMDGAEQKVIDKASRCLKPDGEPLPATFGLIIVLAVCYVITTYPDFERPAEWARVGLFYMPLILFKLEFWRFITPNLMHANLMHLGGNCFGLWIFGRIIEPMLGTKNMILLFVVSGLGCSLTMFGMDIWMLSSFEIDPNSALGASGIDYGVMAVSFCFYLLIRRKTHPHEFGNDLRGMVILLAIYTYLNIADSHVAIWGHLGGFLGGLAFAFIYYALLIRKARKNFQGWGIDTQL